MSEEIFRGVMEIVEPHFPQEITEHGTKIIMGTIEGDIHDLGKNIVSYLLRSVGFKVIDLGVDVPPERFVKAIKETWASILGICVLLTFCIGSIKKVVIIPDLIRIGFQGLHCIDRNSGMDVFKLQQAYGEKLCLWGTLGSDDLARAADPVYFNDLLENIRLLNSRNGFILGTNSGLFKGIDLGRLIEIYKSVG